MYLGACFSMAGSNDSLSPPATSGIALALERAEAILRGEGGCVSNPNLHISVFPPP